MGSIFDSLKKYAEDAQKRQPVEYITGIATISKPTPYMILSIEPDGIVLNRYDIPRTHIKWENMHKISAETQGQVTKSLSMGKAALGLVLLGPLGALLGAGMKDTNDNRQHFISIAYTDITGMSNFESTLVLKTKKAQEIATLLTNKWRSYLTAHNIEPSIAKKAAEPANDDSLDQLEKLAKLKDKGIITEEDFNSKKKQLLGI